MKDDAHITVAQAKTLHRKWSQLQDRGDLAPSFDALLDSAEPYIGGDGAILVPWCGVWLGIEPDGYAHT